MFLHIKLNLHFFFRLHSCEWGHRTENRWRGSRGQTKITGPGGETWKHCFESKQVKKYTIFTFIKLITLHIFAVFASVYDGLRDTGLYTIEMQKNTNGTYLLTTPSHPVQQLFWLMMHCLFRRSPSSPAEDHTHKYEETDNSIPAETEPAAAESWKTLKHHHSGPSSKDGGLFLTSCSSWPVFKQPHTQHTLQYLLHWCFWTLCTLMI